MGSPLRDFWGVFLPGRFGEWAQRYPTQVLYMLMDLAIFAVLYWRPEGEPEAGQPGCPLPDPFFAADALVLDSLRELA